MTTRAHRRQPRGARRPRRARRRAGVEVRRHPARHRARRARRRRRRDASGRRGGSSGSPADAFVVGWVGRMTAVKRTDLVVRALERLVDGGVDARLLLVGDGPDRDGLERYAHELGVVKRCLFLGYQEDVARFYDAIDVLLLPSVNEGTPVSVIEALAAERPAVATRVGGDSRRHPRRRRRVPRRLGDPDALAARLAELAADPAAAGRDGRRRTRARARALRRRAARRRRRPACTAMLLARPTGLAASPAAP